MAEKMDFAGEELSQNSLVKPEAQPANAAKKKKKETDKKKKEAESITLPVLIEFIFTFVTIFLILVFLTMTIVAWLTRITLFDFVLRTSVALLMLGSLLLLLVRQVAADIFRASQAELEEEKNKALAQEIQDPEPPSLSKA
jgi:ABC-type multidrug transport system fused ATPase/permease subunit